MRHRNPAKVLLVVISEGFLELGVDVARQIVLVDLGRIDYGQVHLLSWQSTLRLGGLHLFEITI